MRRLLLLLTAISISVSCITCSHPIPETIPAPISLDDSVRGLAWTTQLSDGSLHYLNHCTVFSVNKWKHLWITAGHCVKHPTDLQISHKPAAVLVLDEEKDMAILYTPFLAEVNSLRIAERSPFVQEPVYIIGFPLGWDYSIRMEGKIIIRRTVINEKPYTLTTALISYGVSGSPILTRRNEVIGIVQVGINCQRFCDVSGGSPYEEMKAFAEPYWEK